MRLPQSVVPPPLPLRCLLPPGGGGKRGTPEAPSLKDSKLRLPPPPPIPRVRGDGRVPHGSQRTGTLNPITATQCTHPKGREETPAAASRTFHFPDCRNSAPPHRLPRQNPATHRNRLCGGGGRAQGFPDALSLEDRAGERGGRR